MNTNLIAKAKKIRLIITDVDGVLTDGQLYFSAEGQALKAFHVHDGLGIKFLLRQNIQIAAISGCNSKILTTRLQQLGIQYIFQGIEDKISIMDRLMSQLNLSAEEIAFIGDDLPDIKCMQQVGLSVAVYNAVDEIKNIAHWVTHKPGGFGAMREFAELILKAQNRWDLIVGSFLT